MLSVFPSTNPLDHPEIFHLQIGENLIGSDPILCPHVISLSEIDALQAKITIYEYGECSIESLSDLYDNYKEYEVIPGKKHHIKLRKNKEYDLFNDSTFYLSKYKAKFNIHFESQNDVISQNLDFSATYFIPDRDISQDPQYPLKNLAEINDKLNFLPTQNLEEPHENEVKKTEPHEKSKEIRKIFQQAVEKIKNSCRQKNNNNEEKELSEVFFSKFLSLYDSVKEEISCFNKASNNNSLNSINSNSNSKAFSTIESPENKDFMKPSIVKEIRKEKIGTMEDIEQNFNKQISLEKEKFIPFNIIQSNEAKKEKEMSESTKEELIKKNDQDSKLLVQSPQITRNDAENENIMIPTIRESQISNNFLQATVRESQFFNNNDFCGSTIREKCDNLERTIRESQLNMNNLEQTVRESQINNNFMPSTLRESQINNNMMGSTVRESQFNSEKNENIDKIGMTPTLIQGIDANNNNNLKCDKTPSMIEEKKGKFIRDSKHNLKKRKLELPELIKIEKRKKLERKIQEEQFQSLKLFIKDEIDDLEDLFERELTSKEQKPQQHEEKPNLDSQKSINGQNIDSKVVLLEEPKEDFKKIQHNQIDETNLNTHENDLLTKKQKKPFESKKIRKNLKIVEEEKKSNDRTASEIKENGDKKKPKLYLSHKSLCFTSNESVNLSGKKSRAGKDNPFLKMKQKKLFIEEESNLNKESNEGSQEEENYYLVSKSKSNSLMIKNNHQENPQPSLENNQNHLDSDKTEKIDSCNEENNENKGKEEIKDSNPSKEKNKEPKNTGKSKKLAGNVKISKTLTQIFNSEDKKENPLISIAISGFKVSKSERLQLNKLGIEIIQDILLESCDALVIQSLKKETNIAIALNKGLTIISKQWIDDCIKNQAIELMDSYHIKDSEFEKKHNVFLEQIILKSKLQGGFLQGYRVWVSESKKYEMKKIVQSAGGVILEKIPEKNEEKTLIFIDEKKTRLISDLLEKKITFYFPDFLFEACLKQELALP